MLLRSAAISALIAEVRSRGELLASAAIFISTRIIRLRCSGSIGHRCVSARAIMRVSRMPIKAFRSDLHRPPQAGNLPCRYLHFERVWGMVLLVFRYVRQLLYLVASNTDAYHLSILFHNRTVLHTFHSMTSFQIHFWDARPYPSCHEKTNTRPFFLCISSLSLGKCHRGDLR